MDIEVGVKGFSLSFEREAYEAVTSGEIDADGLMVAKTHDLMAVSGETDFRKAFARVALANRDMHTAYLNQAGKV